MLDVNDHVVRKSFSRALLESLATFFYATYRTFFLMTYSKSFKLFLLYSNSSSGNVFLGNISWDKLSIQTYNKNKMEIPENKQKLLIQIFKLASLHGVFLGNGLSVLISESYKFISVLYCYFI